MNFKHIKLIVVGPLIMAMLVSTLPVRLAQAQISLPVVSMGVDVAGLSQPFQPIVLSGLVIHPERPFEFDFIVDPGQADLDQQAFEMEAQRLVRFFLTALTVPEDQQWVNLSPYEKNRVIPQQLGFTEFGRQMLVQDYLLKQLTASLIHPDEELGRTFWAKVRERARARYGEIDIPMSTFNKVWIVPDRARIVEKDNKVFIVDNHLRVMLEEDYHAYRQAGRASRQAGQALAASSGMGQFSSEMSASDFGNDYEATQITAEIVREIVIPALQEEVNVGRNFAPLRQIFNSMLLATWFKVTLKESILGQGYANRNKIKGTGIEDSMYPGQVYQKYLEAYTQGTFDLIREEYDPVHQTIIPRKYFSGGVKNPYMLEGDRAMLSDVVERVDPAMLGSIGTNSLRMVNFRLEGVGGYSQNESALGDFAMNSSQPRISLRYMSSFLAGAVLAGGMSVSDMVLAGADEVDFQGSGRMPNAQTLPTQAEVNVADSREETFSAPLDKDGQSHSGFVPFVGVINYADGISGEEILNQIAEKMEQSGVNWFSALGNLEYDLVLVMVPHALTGEMIVSQVIIVGNRGESAPEVWQRAADKIPTTLFPREIQVSNDGQVTGDITALDNTAYAGLDPKVLDLLTPELRIQLNELLQEISDVRENIDQEFSESSIPEWIGLEDMDLLYKWIDLRDSARIDAGFSEKFGSFRRILQSHVSQIPENSQNILNHFLRTIEMRVIGVEAYFYAQERKFINICVGWDIGPDLINILNIFQSGNEGQEPLLVAVAQESPQIFRKLAEDYGTELGLLLRSSTWKPDDNVKWLIKIGESNPDLVMDVLNDPNSDVLDGGYNSFFQTLFKLYPNGELVNRIRQDPALGEYLGKIRDYFVGSLRFQMQNNNPSSSDIDNMRAILRIMPNEEDRRALENEFDDSLKGFYEREMAKEVQASSASVYDKYVSLISFLLEQNRGEQALNLFNKQLAGMLLEGFNHRDNGGYQFVVADFLDLHRLAVAASIRGGREAGELAQFIEAEFSEATAGLANLNDYNEGGSYLDRLRALGLLGPLDSGNGDVDGVIITVGEVPFRDNNGLPDKYSPKRLPEGEYKIRLPPPAGQDAVMRSANEDLQIDPYSIFDLLTWMGVLSGMGAAFLAWKDASAVSDKAMQTANSGFVARMFALTLMFSAEVFGMDEFENKVLATNSTGEAQTAEVIGRERNSEVPVGNLVDPVKSTLSVVRPDEVGGIDFNPANLDLIIERDGRGMPLPVSSQAVEALLSLDGLTPVLIGTGLADIPQIFGLQ